MTPKTIAILIPSYNTPPWKPSWLASLREVALILREKHETHITLVFVDDGSTQAGTTLESHLPPLRAIGVQRTIVTKHELNRGQGAALMTALEIARGPLVDSDYFATIDADGQHDPFDVLVMYEYLIKNHLNIVFGNRFLASNTYLRQIPLLRKWLLGFAIVFEKIYTGLNLGDAHNGLRVFDRKTANLLQIRQDRMAHASEIKKQVRLHRLNYGECRVQISYFPQLGEGQRNSNAINIIQEILREWMF